MVALIQSSIYIYNICNNKFAFFFHNLKLVFYSTLWTKYKYTYVEREPKIKFNNKHIFSIIQLQYIFRISTKYKILKVKIIKNDDETIIYYKILLKVFLKSKNYKFKSFK